MRRLPGSFSEASFRLAWKDSRDSSPTRPGAPGLDRISAQAFSTHLAENIHRIRRNIQRGSYQFARLRVAPIPKASGGLRLIAIPNVQDRLVQRVILRHLEQDPRFPRPSSISYGFTRGRTLPSAQEHALELRREREWVVQSDIIKFFDQIDRRILLTLVSRSIRSKTVAELIGRAINCELDERNPRARSLAIECGIRRGKGLRQGMPLSPVLSNLLLRSFDRALESAGLKTIRYADDIAVFCKSRPACLDALKTIRSELARLKLNIPELKDDSKTKIVEPTQSLEFLGVDIKWTEEGYRLSAPFRRLKIVEDMLSDMANIEYCIKNKITFTQMIRSIDASIRGHERAVQSLADSEPFISKLVGLKKKYEKELLISIVGSNAVSGLSPGKRAVLGLEDF